VKLPLLQRAIGQDRAGKIPQEVTYLIVSK